MQLEFVLMGHIDAVRDLATGRAGARLAAPPYDRHVATTADPSGSHTELVPVIDVAGSGDGDEAVRAEIAAAVDAACRTVGFMQIVGHGIPDAPSERQRKNQGDS